MSLIMQTLTAGSLSANVSSTAAGTNGTSAAGSTAGFAQTLVQSMGGTAAAKGTDTPVLGNLASLLQGLLSAVQAAEGDTGTADVKKGDLLEGLAQDMETLDASLEADPALLAALQGWLLQAAVLLSGSNPSAQEDAAEGNTGMAAVLSPLAQSADTLRFAVQDELNSLVGLIQDAAASGNEDMATKGAALLNQFSAILAESAPEGSKAQTKASRTEESAVSPEQAAGVENKPETAAKGNVASEVRTLLQAAVRTDQGVEVSAVTGTAASKPEEAPEPATTGLAAVTKKAGDIAEEALPAAKAPAGESEVVTAGQLSLRNGITAPLKAESAPVPVQQFAQEMSSFISGKLDIVQKGGVAEATITLFPENLGQVDVKITMQNGNLVAQFLTQHTGTKDILEQQMNQLRLALQSQGLQVEKLEVSQNSASPQSQWTGQQGQQAGTGGQQQQGRRSRERQEESGDALLAAELNGEWKDWVAERQQANLQNGGFSAKA